MNRPARKITADSAGSAAIEFAIAAPLFLTLVFGIIQFGTIALARAGLEQAVEVGARYATLYPRPSDESIKSRVLSSQYGLDSAKITGPTIVYGNKNGMPYAEISMGYAAPLNFVFYKAAPIQLTYKRLVYVAPVG